MSKVKIYGTAMVRFKKVMDIDPEELEELLKSPDIQECQIDEDDLQEIHEIHTIEAVEMK